MPTNEKFADMDKEQYTPGEAYEISMKDIKAIYEDAAAHTGSCPRCVTDCFSCHEDIIKRLPFLEGIS